jgi:hypothetical protein
MRESSLKACPVPTEQQPINEYEQLKESWFFRWATLEKTLYWRKLTIIWLLGWLIVSPIAASSFPPPKSPILFGISSYLGAAALLMLVLLQLWLGWCYIGDRLKKETVFYEESGWYDGQTWVKPPEVLTRDRLILSYQVAPILQRLTRTVTILAVLMIGDGIVWLCL